MASENKIVELINDSCKASLQDSRFDGKKLFGITVLTENSDGKVIPAWFNELNEPVSVSIDDTFPVQLYHRLYRSQEKQDVKLFPGQKFEITSLSIIVISNRKKIKMPAEDLKLIISSGLLQTVSKPDADSLGIISANIIPTACDYNSIALFKREHQVQTFDPELIMFELFYSIECKYSLSCINKICCN